MKDVNIITFQFNSTKGVIVSAMKKENFFGTMIG